MGEPKRRPDLRRLVDRLERPGDGLAAGVVRPAQSSDRRRLEAVLEVPDRRRRLRCPRERLVEHGHEPVVVALADIHVVARGRRLSGKQRIRVVTCSVEERQLPAARTVGRGDGADERGRIVARGRGGQDVDARHGRVQDVPAAGEERGVVLRCALAGLPERVRVRLVPDHDVPHLAVADEDVAHEAAVVLAGGGVMRGVDGTAVDAQDDPDAESIRCDRPAERVVVGRGQMSLAGPPSERHSHASETEGVHRAEDRRRPLGPLDAVVVHSDQQVRARTRRVRSHEQDQE